MNTFHPLEVVGRGSDTQLQVGEKLKSLIQGFGMFYKDKDYRS